VNQQDLASLGYNSEAEYLQGAQALLSGGHGGDVVTSALRWENGDVVIFNYNTGEFAVTTSKGALRTYFRPGGEQPGYTVQRSIDYYNGTVLPGLVVLPPRISLG